MPRVIWKGAISFGLVHVPIAMYPASQDVGIDFDWLDKRSMDPVGYKRDQQAHRQGDRSRRTSSRASSRRAASTSS